MEACIWLFNSETLKSKNYKHIRLNDVGKSLALASLAKQENIFPKKVLNSKLKSLLKIFIEKEVNRITDNIETI